ncbi:prolyl oligopeptidase family serine peptidase, partial [Lysobacter capsici]
RPVLLLAGAKDQKVTLRSITDYAARLRLADRDVGLLVDPDAGHSTRAPIAREAQMYLSERLLHARLGGVSAAPPSAALRDYLQRNLRLANGDLRDLRPRSAADPDRIATSSR